MMQQFSNVSSSVKTWKLSSVLVLLLIVISTRMKYVKLLFAGTMIIGDINQRPYNPLSTEGQEILEN